MSNVSMACDREKMDDYIGALRSVVDGDVAKENLEVILKDAKKMHEEAGLQITKDFVEEVEAFIAKETKEIDEIFNGVYATAKHIYEQADSVGAFKVQ